MDIQDLLNDAKNITTEELEQRLNKLCRENYRYKNLDPKNRKVVMDILKKYMYYVRKGIKISYNSVYKEMYKLNKSQDELDLTDEDLKDIREILDELRK
jgi:hypothetical protein